jgi:hypothetical protein
MSFDIETKMWGHSNTGTKVHGYLNGKALCRSGINQPAGTGIDYFGAKDAYGDRICANCYKKFNAAIERYEASMMPSNGEGDHLPPAKDSDADTWPELPAKSVDAMNQIRYRKTSRTAGRCEADIPMAITAETRNWIFFARWTLTGAYAGENFMKRGEFEERFEIRRDVDADR